MHKLIRTAGVVTALGALTAAIAVAAGAPTATTSPATNVTATAATLTGSVDPNGTDTTYDFQYGTSTAYGQQTATQGPIKGNGAKSVSAGITGLAPSTTYHYRVTATSSSGSTSGQDVSFTTAAPGASGGDSITITSTRKRVVFGKPVTISGAVTGSSPASVSLTLEQNPAPFTGGFQSTGQTTTTNSTGGYAFAVSPAANTHYRVVEKPKKGPTSPELAIDVAVRVSLHVSDSTPRKGQKVSFTGGVFPAHDGTLASIQRRTSAGWRTVATTPLVAATPVNGVTRSRFAKRLKIRRTGTYRVHVLPTDGDHVAGNSRRRTLRVH